MTNSATKKAALDQLALRQGALQLYSQKARPREMKPGGNASYIYFQDQFLFAIVAIAKDLLSETKKENEVEIVMKRFLSLEKALETIMREDHNRMASLEKSEPQKPTKAR